MSTPSITIEKSIKSDPIPTVWYLKMQVTEALGITPKIFVTKYTPASRYTGPATHVYNNVAYLDELTTIPDDVSNSAKRTTYRSSVLQYVFRSSQELDRFVSEVYGYIQRLLKQVGEGLTENCQHSLDVITSQRVDSSELPGCTDSEAPESGDVVASGPLDEFLADNDLEKVILTATGD